MIHGMSAGADSIRTRFHDRNSSVGEVTTPQGKLRIEMLAHPIVPRACPVLSPSELADLERASSSPSRRPRGKARFWASLLQSAYVLHCFPPGGEPAKGEKRLVFMGHPKHTQAEVAFAKRQGLWRLHEGWRERQRAAAAAGSSKREKAKARAAPECRTALARVV